LTHSLTVSLGNVLRRVATVFGKKIQGLSSTFSRPIPATFRQVMLEYLMFLASHETVKSIVTQSFHLLSWRQAEYLWQATVFSC